MRFFLPVITNTNGNANVGNVNSTGNVDGNVVDNDYWVRPVVSLIPGTQVEANGNGSTSNPYKVKLDN